MQTGLEHVKTVTLSFEVKLVEAAAAAVTSSPLSGPHNIERFRPALCLLPPQEQNTGNRRGSDTEGSTTSFKEAHGLDIISLLYFLWSINVSAQTVWPQTLRLLLWFVSWFLFLKCFILKFHVLLCLPALITSLMCLTCGCLLHLCLVWTSCILPQRFPTDFFCFISLHLLCFPVSWYIFLFILSILFFYTLYFWSSSIVTTKSKWSLSLRSHYITLCTISFIEFPSSEKLSWWHLSFISGYWYVIDLCLCRCLIRTVKCHAVSLRHCLVQRRILQHKCWCHQWPSVFYSQQIHWIISVRPETQVSIILTLPVYSPTSLWFSGCLVNWLE